MRQCTTPEADLKNPEVADLHECKKGPSRKRIVAPMLKIIGSCSAAGAAGHRGQRKNLVLELLERLGDRELGSSMGSGGQRNVNCNCRSRRECEPVGVDTESKAGGALLLWCRICLAGSASRTPSRGYM